MGEGRREQDIAGYFHVVKYMCIYSVLDLCMQIHIRGQSMDCAAQTTDCLVHSQVQSKVLLKVSGVALAS